MKKLYFLTSFMILFLVFGVSLLFHLDSHFYTGLTFHLFKPSLSFFQLCNTLYVFFFSLSLSEAISFYSLRDLKKTFLIKIAIHLFSFISIPIFFNSHILLGTFLGSLSLFISLLYVYEEVSIFNEKSTRYLDINVLYSLFLSAYTFCLYVLNCL